jgi:hypothetical protein
LVFLEYYAPVPVVGGSYGRIQKTIAKIMRKSKKKIGKIMKQDENVEKIQQS